MHQEIDKIKWDKCIDEAENGLIYGYSFYLDHMARHWDALVLNDYEVVMPLAWNKKFWIYYLYQPAFTAALGIFARPPARAGTDGDDPFGRGKNLNEEIINQFIQSIPQKFRLIEISLNPNNHISTSPFIISRVNYFLSLHKSYDDIYKNYRENHQRNIQKALQAGCNVKKNIPVEEVIALNKQQMKDLVSLTDNDYDRFKKLYYFLSGRNKAITYGMVDSQNKLIASCVFFFSHNRAYYILVGNHPDSRATGASHALIDAFIKDHVGENMILDFEGSDIESLALFYSGFGATKEIYPAIRWNRLPWWVRWMKR
ncbi:MAG: hypothetical protein ACHQF0_06010 [Chitinophagales bacterium]